MWDSVSEAVVDNWLAEHIITHNRHTNYPGTNYKADWSVGNVFLEYFGLANDSPRYDRSLKYKLLLWKRLKIKLIPIYPKDLYPVNQLNRKLSFLIRDL